MSGTQLPKGVFVVVLLAALAGAVRNYSLLPDRLASHFAASGLPNGWMTKPQFFFLYAVLIGLAGCVGFLVPTIVSKTDISRINLPNKEYWLAPERRNETFEFLGKSFAWYGCVILLLEVFTIQLVIGGNLNPNPQLPTGLVMFLVSVFLIFNIVWLIIIFRRFAKP